MVFINILDSDFFFFGQATGVCRSLIDEVDINPFPCWWYLMLSLKFVFSFKMYIRPKSPYYWIGITKNHMNENWTWIGNNSTWVGEQSWAENEPNNNHSTEFCVEIYVNTGPNRGKWNDEKCGVLKYAVCYKAQCNATSCGRGRCQEMIENITCLCEPGFKGDRCQTECHLRCSCPLRTSVRSYISALLVNLNLFVPPAMECPPLSQPDNGYLSCSGGNLTFNSTCRFECQPGFLIIGPPDVTCSVTGVWSGPRPICTSNYLKLCKRLKYKR
uniref:L-selectin n=1 Tax=Sander lucioperca TaxID=283035 RepID=A0A8D0D451_SANLU